MRIIMLLISFVWLAIGFALIYSGNGNGYECMIISNIWLAASLIVANHGKAP